MNIRFAGAMLSLLSVAPVTGATCLYPLNITASVSQSLSTSRAEIGASGFASVTNLQGETCWFMSLTAETTISEDGTETYSTFKTGQGELLVNVDGRARVGSCYSSELVADNAVLPQSTASAGPDCWYGPPDPGGGGDGDGPFHEEGGTPIVINLANGGPWRFSDASDPVTFDLKADGSPRRWTWTARDSRIAFLALDRNGNGRVDDGSELFGDHNSSANGFELLRTFDGRADGRITAQDGIWRHLLLWVDANHNGVSEPEELEPLGMSGIEALDLTYQWTAHEDRGGTAFRYRSLVHIAGRVEPYYDIVFRSVR